MKHKRLDQVQIDEAVEQLHTVRDFLRWAASRFEEAGVFYGHGTDNAFDEAYALVIPALHLPFNLHPDYLNARLTMRERRAIVDWVQERVESRTPAAYLTHQAWFAGLSFYVDERVLVPRSPIAELIEHHFEPWVEPDKIKRVLDLCCGSGCIGIACAHWFPNAQVDCSDISEDALAVAAINIERHDMQDQVRAVESDLFEELHGQKYDLIVCNPPYVDETELAAMPDEFHAEPELGLAAGEDGLDLAIRILCDAADHLNPQGVLILEVGASAEALEGTFPEVAFTWLDFERGGDGVALLTADQVREYRAVFRTVREERSR
ncbi:MAG: 50S ribosomal protein L3 N(5)-glutamine methyltransferase [Gammaproteobacteria bacterium]|nr:50S ribosomal protein L3 N(5)-glutamine methyltransferase [Gammaproteobacteria bacterium]